MKPLDPTLKSVFSGETGRDEPLDANLGAGRRDLLGSSSRRNDIGSLGKGGGIGLDEVASPPDFAYLLVEDDGGVAMTARRRCKCC